MAKILILVERFYPEDFLVNDLAGEWKRMGHEVEVLTQVPSYPFDRIFDGYENKTFQTTMELDGIPVHRVSTIFGYNKSVCRKIMNYLHFGWLTSWWALWNGRRFDRVFVYHTASLTMACAVLPLKWIWRKKIAIWTQDLWPDAVWGFGFKYSKWKSALLNAFIRMIYAGCDRIAVSCRKYIGRIEEIAGRKSEWVPQWEPAEMRLPAKAAGGPVVFMFAGNLGVPQNLPRVIDGFVKAELPEAELWLVGAGVMLNVLQAQFGNETKVKFCGRKLRSEMPQWFAQADALIISLTDQYKLTLPGKFQSYIKTGKPILGVINGDARDLIEEYRLGFAADPNDLEAVAGAFRELYEAIRSGKAGEFGERAKELSARVFDRKMLIGKLLEITEMAG